MRLRYLAFLTAVVFVGSLHGMAQFLRNLAQFDNGVNLISFREGDFNGDGKADIVGLRSPQSNSFQVVVLPGNGTGGFGAPIITAITAMDSIQLSQFLVGDFNGDGHMDIALFGNDHVTGIAVVGVMLGNEDGTFQAPRETPSGLVGVPPAPETFTVTTGDYNGDGKPDIAYIGGGESVTVALGRGDGTFSPPITTAWGGPPLALGITTGDFNRDNKPDLAIATFGPFGVYWLQGKGDGTFYPPLLVGNVNDSWPIGVADLNGDGNPDIVVSGTVFLGDGTGKFPTTHTYRSMPQATIMVQDLNGDGHPDIVVLGNSNNPRIFIINLNNGDGSFTVGKSYNGDGQTSSVGLLAADLNGDRKTDLAFANEAGGISVLLGNGNGTFKGHFATFANGIDIRPADFNLDSKPDLAVVGGSVLLGNGDGTFRVANGVNYCPGLTLAVGDFNHDGRPDLAGNTQSSGVPVIDVCLGNGDGTFNLKGDFDQGVQHKVVLPGDFNNDGKIDLVASDQNGFSVLLGNGDGTFQNGIPTAVSASFPSLAVGDFNNDGRLDVAAATPAGIAVFLGKGDGTFAAPIISAGGTGGFLTVADLNKDGKRDVVVANGTGITVLLGKGNGSFQPPLHFALNANVTTRAVVADFNGDGNLDVAVGASGHVIDVLFGDGHGKLLTPPNTFRAGALVTGIASSDFNGDKKIDVAVMLQGGIVVTFLHQ